MGRTKINNAGSLSVGLVVCLLLPLFLMGVLVHLSPWLTLWPFSVSGIQLPNWFAVAYLLIGIIFLLYVSYAFFRVGLVEIKLGHVGLYMPFGSRENTLLLSEGWHWTPFVGRILEVDVREHSLDTLPAISLSKDNIPVTVDVSAQARICDPLKFISFNEAHAVLGEVIQRTVRWYANTKSAVDLVASKESFSVEIERAIDRESEVLGIAVRRVHITDIRIPAELENSFTRRQKEVVDKRADMTQIVNLIERVRALVQTGMSPEKALDAAQTETGKVDKVIIDGSASDLLKAAGILHS